MTKIVSPVLWLFNFFYGVLRVELCTLQRTMTVLFLSSILNPFSPRPPRWGQSHILMQSLIDSFIVRGSKNEWCHHVVEFIVVELLLYSISDVTHHQRSKFIQVTVISFTQKEDLYSPVDGIVLKRKFIKSAMLFIKPKVCIQKITSQLSWTLVHRSSILQSNPSHSEQANPSNHWITV